MFASSLYDGFPGIFGLAPRDRQKENGNQNHQWHLAGELSWRL